MGTTKNSKGQMRVIETLLAAFIFASALSFVNVFAVLPSSSRYEVIDLEKMGHNILHDLDDHRILGRLVYDEKWEDLRLALLTFLPPDVYFNLTVYDIDGTLINQDMSVSYCAEETFKTSNWTASVIYIISGCQSKYESQYKPRILLLQLARG